MILEKERQNNATNEATGAATSRRYGNTMTSGEGKVNYNGQLQPLQDNAMAAPAGTARKYGTTVTSGGGKVMANGISANASGADIGNMADVTNGVSKVKGVLSGSAYGLNGSKVGFNENTGYMTYNGQNMNIKATDYSGGVNDTNKAALSDAYAKTTGDEVVSGRQYAEVNSGLGANAMRYQDGKVYLGGHEVPYQYIDAEGNAHVSKRVLDGIIEQVRAENGIQRGTDIVSDVYGKYADEMSRQMDKVINREDWNYNPDRDPAYAAYEDIYRRNAEQAYNRAMGMGGLYSRPTSYQRQNALSGYNDQMQALSDMVPELAQDDYNRYYNEQLMNQQALTAVQNERNNELNAIYGANTDEISRMRDADETNYSRAYDAMYGYPMAAEQLKQAQYSTAMAEIDKNMYPTVQAMLIRSQQGQLTAQELQNNAQKLQNVIEAGYTRGYYTADEAAWLGVPESTSPYAPEVQAQIYQYQQLAAHGLV